MSGKRNISYVRPQDPSFLSKLKAEIGYKEGPTVETKRQRLECDPDSDGQSDREEEKPQIVVLQSGDLTAEEVAKEEARIAQEAAKAPADLSKPITFKSKQVKDTKEATIAGYTNNKISKKSTKSFEQLNKSKLSFTYDDQESE